MAEQVIHPEFGTFTNLALTLTVMAFGVYWLFQPKGQLPFRRRAFLFWWGSWLVWVIVWSLLLIRKHPPIWDTFTIEILVLVFDNLNTIFLTVFYFTLTRGDSMNAKQAGVLTLAIMLGLAVLFGAFYILFGVFLKQVSLAYDIHRTCTLCLSVLTPILVGWALNLRFKNPLAFIVGCLYGFIQPIIYATELRGLGEEVFATFDLGKCNQAFPESLMCSEIHSSITQQQYVEALRPAVSMAVGLLKVVWAIICTRLLSGYRATTDNLVVVDASLKRAEEWRPSVRLHATVLAVVYLGLLITLLMAYSGKQFLIKFGTAVGVITSVFALWQMISFVWGKLRVGQTHSHLPGAPTKGQSP